MIKPKIVLSEESLTIIAVLADNKIDSDSQKMSMSCLRDIACKCVGVCGYVDNSESKIAKILKAIVLKDNSTRVDKFELYTYIEVTIQIDRNKDTEQFIQNIIKSVDENTFEITVSFMESSQKCSVCWSDIYKCEHSLGTTYGEDACCGVIHGCTDFYTFCIMTHKCGDNHG